MADKETILGVVGDLVYSFLYYDRQEDEDLPLGAIEQALASGEITIEEISFRFWQCLVKGTAR